MKTVSLSGTLRAYVGKKDAKKHRREGNVPCVLYGGKEQVHFIVNDFEFGKLIFTPEVNLVNLDIEGKTTLAILQDVQYHPVTDKVLHADFLVVTDDKPITVALPIKTSGVSPGVLAGGKMHMKMRKLVVKGLVNKVPEIITIDISKMTIGSSIKVKDIQVDGLTFLNVPSAVVVSVKTARVIALEEDEEEDEEAEGAEGAESSEAAEGAPSES
ncbi:MAG TPA: 50S ribosomal protein L25/general stress protein Ctc [Bacteroidales bacterium]